MPAVNPRGALRAPKESKSESGPSDKEPNQQLKDSSDLTGTSSILSPLTGLSLSGQGEPIETDPPKLPKDEPDPFKEDFVDASEHPDQEPIQVDHRVPHCHLLCWLFSKSQTGLDTWPPAVIPA